MELKIGFMEAMSKIVPGAEYGAVQDYGFTGE
jgi:hypothetical protein